MRFPAPRQSGVSRQFGVFRFSFRDLGWPAPGSGPATSTASGSTWVCPSARWPATRGSDPDRGVGAADNPVHVDLAERAAYPGLLVVMKDEPLVVTLNPDELFRWIDQHDLSVERMQPGVGSVFGRKKADEKQSDNESRENSWEAHRSVVELRAKN